MEKIFQLFTSDVKTKAKGRAVSNNQGNESKREIFSRESATVVLARVETTEL